MQFNNKVEKLDDIIEKDLQYLPTVSEPSVEQAKSELKPFAKSQANFFNPESYNMKE